MARYKSRQPLPSPLEAWGEVPMDSPNGRKLIARHLPRIRNYRALIRALGEMSHWLNAQLFERNRVNAKAVRARLSELHDALNFACHALDTLGPDASKVLARRAAMHIRRPPSDNGDSLWQWLEPADQPASGAERIRWVIRALADCSRWAAEAQVAVDIPKVIIEPPDPDVPGALPRRSGGGRPRDWDAEDVMRSLIDVWVDQTGEHPTISTDPASGRKKTDKPFLAFCEAVIAPIYAARGIEPPRIGALGQKMVYSQERAERTKMKTQEKKSD